MKIAKNILACATLLITAALGHADTLLVSLGGSVGTVQQGNGFWDGTVAVGTPIFATFQIDTNASSFPNDSYSTLYQSGPGFTASFTVGDYTFVGASTYLIIGKDPVNPAGTYYDFFASLPDQNGLTTLSIEADFTFANASDLGGTALSDLTVHPLDQFSSTTLLVSGNPIGSGSTSATWGPVLAYNIIVVPTPEPSTWALIGLGVMLLPLLHRARIARA